MNYTLGMSRDYACVYFHFLVVLPYLCVATFTTKNLDSAMSQERLKIMMISDRYHFMKQIDA